MEERWMKILFSDFDGTLVENDTVLSQRNDENVTRTRTLDGYMYW